MNLCRDCRHMMVPVSGIQYARCTFHHLPVKTNPVTGEKVIADPYCAIERERTVEGYCGAEGVNFEAAHSFTAEGERFPLHGVNQVAS